MEDATIKVRTLRATSLPRHTGDFDPLTPEKKSSFLEQNPKATREDILAMVQRGELSLADLHHQTATSDHPADYFAPFCADKEIVLTAVHRDGAALASANIKGLDGKLLNDDNDVVMAAIQAAGTALRFASERLRGDETVVQAAVEKDPTAIVHATPALLQRMEGLVCRILSTSRSYAQLWHQLPAAIKKHRTVAIAALRADGMLLEHMPSEMQKDEEVVMCAVSQNGDAVQFACKSLRSLRAIALMAVRYDGLELKDLSLALCHDPEIVRVAVTQNVDALQYALGPPRGDEDLVTMAVGRNGAMLAHASDDLQCKMSIASVAIANCPAVYRDLCRSARNNRDIALATVQRNGMMLQHMSSDFQKDRDIVLAAVTQNGDAIQFACRSLRGNKDIAMAAVAFNGLRLRDVLPELQDDADIVLTAVQQNPLALEFASARFRDDAALVGRLVQVNGAAFKFASKSLQQNPTIALDAVTQNGAAYCLLSGDVRHQRTIALAAVEKNGLYLRDLDKEFRSDKGIVQQAMRSNPTVICYADAALKKDPDLLSMLSDKQRALYAGTWGIPLPETYWPAMCPKEQWVSDSAVSECKCGASFGLFTRRHHCRICGQVCCSDCSFDGIAMAGQQGVHRCCLTCFEASRLRAQAIRSTGIPLTPQIADVSAFHKFLQHKLRVPPAYCSSVDLVSAVDVAVVIDDSGSMRFPTRPDNADAPSRWAEMQTVLAKMFEVWAFLGMKVDVYFMNRSDAKGVASMAELNVALQAPPNGGTPTVKTLTRLLQEKVSADAPRPLVTYLFTDGEPDRSFEVFERFLQGRPCKQHSLFSIILCTDEEPIVAQYRRLEHEVVLMPDGVWNSIGISGIDVTEDFFGEQRDVKRLGHVAPLQLGEYLVKCLVGPLDPAVHLIDLPARPLYLNAPERYGAAGPLW